MRENVSFNLNILSALANISLSFNNLSIIKGTPLHVIHIYIVRESNVEHKKARCNFYNFSYEYQQTHSKSFTRKYTFRIQSCLPSREFLPKSCRWNPSSIDSVTLITRIPSKSPHWENCPETTTFERVGEKKNKRSRGVGSCGENALEERRRLSDRAASETFTTSVSRVLRSSRGRQFLQAGPGLSCQERLPGERRFACLLASSLLVDALSRHYRFSTGVRTHEGTVTSPGQGRLSLVSSWPSLSLLILFFPFAPSFDFRLGSTLFHFSLFLSTTESFCFSFAIDSVSSHLFLPLFTLLIILIIFRSLRLYDTSLQIPAIYSLARWDLLFLSCSSFFFHPTVTRLRFSRYLLHDFALRC